MKIQLNNVTSREWNLSNALKTSMGKLKLFLIQWSFNFPIQNLKITFIYK